MPKKPIREFLTSAEVCELLSIDRSTLARWVKAGRLTPVMKMPGVRGGYVFDRSSIQVPKKAS